MKYRANKRLHFDWGESTLPVRERRGKQGRCIIEVDEVTDLIPLASRPWLLEKGWITAVSDEPVEREGIAP